MIAPPKKKFIGGVLILSMSTLLCKIIGLIFKMPMIRCIGMDGMAFFTSAYHIYILITAISTAGLPVAVSMLVSRSRVHGNRANVKRVFFIALLLFLLLGAAGTCVLALSANAYASAIGIPGAASSVLAIAPAILFISVSSAIRGYFQGHEIMAPTAFSQLIESVGKLAIGITLASLAITAGADTPDIAAAAVFGMTAGVGLAMLYLCIRISFFRSTAVYATLPSGADHAENIGKVVSQLLVISLPITLSASVTSITGLADTALITNGLVKGGLAPDIARMYYSCYTNLAVPLFNLTPAFINTLAISLVPALTASIASGNRLREKTVFDASFRLCVFVSLPAAAGISVFAKPILTMLYPLEVPAVATAAPLLSVLGLSVVFSAMMTVSNAVLQAYSHPGLPIISMAAGAAAKCVIEYFLIPTPVGIYAAPISTIVCTVGAMLLNLVFISRNTPYDFPTHSIWRPLAASVVSISAAVCTYLLMMLARLSNTPSLLSSILCAVVIYIIASLKFNAVTASDIQLIPGGEKIQTVLRKMRLLNS